MKAIIFTTIFLFSVTSMAGWPVSEGTYMGSGTFKKLDGAINNYDSLVEIDEANSKWITTYIEAGGSCVYDFDVVDKGNDFFDLYDNGVMAGTGYCHGDSCRLKTDYPSPCNDSGYSRWAVTYTFKGDKAYRSGIKHDTEAIVLEDTLALQ